jgi:hypothetical protein
MKPITKFETVEAHQGKKKIYIGAYVDEKTASRVKENIKDFVKVKQ